MATLDETVRKPKMTKRLRELKARFIVDELPVSRQNPSPWRKRMPPPRDVIDIRRELKHLDDAESKEIKGARLALLWVLGLATAPCNVFAPTKETP